MELKRTDRPTDTQQKQPPGARLRMVLLPLPVGPTTANVVDPGTSNETPCAGRQGRRQVPVSKQTPSLPFSLSEPLWQQNMWQHAQM